LYKDGKLVFKKLKTLENMGRLDVLVVEKSGTLTKSDESSVRKWWILDCEHSDIRIDH
jgi:magnesium-transporting ATPase (P-type)